MPKKLTQEKPLKNFLEIPYDKLEEMNVLAAKDAETKTAKQLEEKYRSYLRGEKRLKAVTLCFSDIEGRFHMLDYDKNYFLSAADNLTFDGSSIRGFSAQKESDLRLCVDWRHLYWLPSDVFGPGKVIMFATVLNRDMTPYDSDFRGRLIALTEALKKESGIVPHMAAELEGFLVNGVNAEQNYDKSKGFELISSGGYFHSLPRDQLKLFIDAAAEAQMEDVRLRKELRARPTEAGTAAEAEARARREREEEERRTRDEMLGAVLEEERLRREKQEREIQRICEVRVVCVYVFM